MSWNQADKDQWLKEQTVKRSYLDEVVTKIRELGSQYDVVQYGALKMNPTKYPVFVVKSKKPDPAKKTILITGGVHGYETSGVHGALAFMKDEAPKYADKFNFICTPCVSPWAYETINRWTPKAIDPNRSFIANSPAEECELFWNALSGDLGKIYAHFDLHETTDTDNTVFRPAKEARDGIKEPFSEIPDGFYTVGDAASPTPAFQKAIIDSVRNVTHIALADSEGNLIGEPLEQEGVINIPLKKYSLCAGVSDAKYVTTTEVYPDSPRVTNAICVDAQVAAVRGGLDWILKSSVGPMNS
ncbi:MAG: M14 family metallocarboxypeptidase [Bdellovibrionales bacterium]|nr:M14 family metallocarboxypeptidase [Bdellovibrionales bacterium]